MGTLESIVEEKEPLNENVRHFLGSWQEVEFENGFDEEIQNKLIDAQSKVDLFEVNLNSSLHENEEGSSDVIAYDKYKKAFFVKNVAGNGGAVFSEAEILSSRHFSDQVSFEAGFIDKGLNARSLLEKYKKLLVSDYEEKVFGEIIAEYQQNKESKKDALKAKAYGAILEKLKSNEDGLARGVLAEKLARGFLEEMSFRNSDLKVEILPASPYDDVEEKIDFIIKRSEKFRKVGVSSDEQEAHFFGIQLTTNKNAISHKHEQIQKAKDKGVHVDDLLFVFIPPEILDQAMSSWNSKSLQGPWKFLPSQTKKEFIEVVFNGILDKNEIEIIEKQNL